MQSHYVSANPILRLLFLLAVFLSTGAASSAMAERRVALVVGNSNYSNAPKLRNPQNDAELISTLLKRLGFEVISGINLGFQGFAVTQRRFSEALRGADVGLFYYAGHGIQVNGRNYLLPIDAKLEDEVSLGFEAVPLFNILSLMEGRTKTNLVFLDACRDNPLAQVLARSLGTRSSQVARGLAPIESGIGTLIVYSTQPDAVASDGRGDNSPFTSALAKYMELPGIDVALILRKVREDVMQATQQRQVPWDHSSLTGSFVFNPTESEEHKTELSNFDKKVYDYLVRNPEVLVQMTNLLDKKIEAAERKKTSQVLRRRSSVVFNPSDGAVVSGKPGDVTVAEFFDYNCAYCKRAFKDIDRLLKSDSRIRLVLHELPLFGDDSQDVAKVAIASRSQNRYWDFHKAMFEHPGRVDLKVALEVATKIGLNIPKLKHDMKSSETSRTIKENAQLAKDLNLKGTPLFFVDGDAIPGAPETLFDDMSAKIAHIRKNGCQFCDVK